MTASRLSPGFAMNPNRIAFAALTIALVLTSSLLAQEKVAPKQKRAQSPPIQFGPYQYETKPNDAAFAKFFPRKAPAAGKLLIQKGDRLAIIGDSITEQKKYSRIIETYLTVCVPQHEVTVRQYGWSGEKADGFLRRMDNDCLRFDPTLATLCYGMNDARYRPFDITNGMWYRDHYTAVVRKLKAAGARVVLGSPGCSGKIASWVKSRSGTLDEHNLNLCALRDICIDIARSEDVRFADQFWPMFQQQHFADLKYSTADKPYQVAGKDGIHPDWAGHVMMAYAFLRSMGLSGEVGTVTVDLATGSAAASDGHTVDSFANGKATITSSRYPFCARGDVDDHASIRSGMTLVPFNEELNRFTLVVKGLTADQASVQWGQNTKTYTKQQLAAGVNLADDFVENPFFAAFEKVDTAVAKKQAYETIQVKRVFHSKKQPKDMETRVKETEAERQPLADAIAAAMQNVTHTISVVETN